MANSITYNPLAYVLVNLSDCTNSNFLRQIEFKIIGSRLAIRRIVCKHIGNFSYCGFIHTAHLVSWLKLEAIWINSKIEGLKLVTSRVFESHRDWDPVNLDVNSQFVAVEATYISRNSGEPKFPRILFYNVNYSQFVWYSISLQESAVSPNDVLSFVLTTGNTSEADLGNGSILIVANRKDNSNLLIYYRTRPMVMSINSLLTQEELAGYELSISNISQYKLTELFNYSKNEVPWINVQIFTGTFIGVILVLVLGIWIFKRSTNENLLIVERTN